VSGFSRTFTRRRPEVSQKFVNQGKARAHSRPKTHSAGRKNISAATCRSLPWGPSFAMRPHRFVTPRGFRRLRDVFPSVASAACSRVFARERARAVYERGANFCLTGRRPTGGRVTCRATDKPRRLPFLRVPTLTPTASVVTASVFPTSETWYVQPRRRLPSAST